MYKLKYDYIVNNDANQSRLFLAQKKKKKMKCTAYEKIKERWWIKNVSFSINIWCFIIFGFLTHLNISSPVCKLININK